MTAVIIKNIPQSPFSQSTIAPDEAASVVLPAVPIDARIAVNTIWNCAVRSSPSPKA